MLGLGGRWPVLAWALTGLVGPSPPVAYRGATPGGGGEQALHVDIGRGPVQAFQVIHQPGQLGGVVAGLRPAVVEGEKPDRVLVVVGDIVVELDAAPRLEIGFGAGQQASDNVLGQDYLIVYAYPLLYSL